MISGVPVRIVSDDKLPEGMLSFRGSVSVIGNGTQIPVVQGGLSFRPVGELSPVPSMIFAASGGNGLAARLFFANTAAAQLSQLRSLVCFGQMFQALSAWFYAPQSGKLIALPQGGVAVDVTTPASSTQELVTFGLGVNLDLSASDEIDLILMFGSSSQSFAAGAIIGQLNFEMRNFSVNPFAFSQASPSTVVI